jgi:hypothetical protein
VKTNIKRTNFPAIKEVSIKYATRKRRTMERYHITYRKRRSAKRESEDMINQ